MLYRSSVHPSVRLSVRPSISALFPLFNLSIFHFMNFLETLQIN